MEMLKNNYKLISLLLIIGSSGGAQSKECYSCEGINCLRTAKVGHKVTCLDPVDNCVTVFDAFTVVARGCYTMLGEEQRNKCDQAVHESDCHKCSQSLCNDKGAISCLQCNSENNKDCVSANSKIVSTPCPVSTSMNSYCYTRKISNKIERGCLVDTQEQLKCLSDSSCEMCIADSDDTCNRESTNDIESGSKRVAATGVLLLMVCLISKLL